MIRVGFDLSITAFNAAGNARYARCLWRALHGVSGIELVPLRLPLPPALVAQGPGPRRTALVALWEVAYAPHVLPLLARRYRLDLLHCPLPMPLRPGAVPSVVTVLDAIPALFPAWFPPIMGLRLRRWLRRGVLAADAVITISHATAADVRRLFPDLPTPVYPVHLGSFLEGIPAPVRPDQPPYLLAVGTLEPRKNLARALEAYAMLVHRRPGVPRLVVVGGQGWGGVDLEAIIGQYGIAGNVERAGYVSDAALHALYAGAGLLVYPSLYEGFGFPVLEAMSAGCPVVTSNISSLPEIAGAAALTVDPNDPAQIAAAMEQVLSSPDLAQRLRREGRRRARAFSWERCASETAAVYRATLARKSY